MSNTEDLIVRLRKASVAVYLACEAPVADDLSLLLSSAADWIDARCLLSSMLADPGCTDE